MKPLLGTSAKPSGVQIWLLFLRIGVAGLMLTHGVPKLTKILNGNFEFADPIGIGTAPSLVLSMLAEFGGSLLLLIGFQTRLAALLLIINMLVVIFFAHSADPFFKREMPILYLLIYGTLFFLGAGKYSVDGRGNNNRLTRY
ncbi:DoxX family protein [Larkinella soli]|uniref:DoxX family protein n=1 Tax=Larkinella soli TaxID=1770527 RepID=UPI000FFCC45C|nr:DoxX family protein [Larkinella soli]